MSSSPTIDVESAAFITEGLYALISQLEEEALLVTDEIESVTHPPTHEERGQLADELDTLRARILRLNELASSWANYAAQIADKEGRYGG